MVRWAPDSRGRLEQAAYELFEDQGFDRTTVAQIAARAGVTERTFFRQYADKREVLFAGSAALQQLLVDAVTSAPRDAPTIVVVRAALDAVGTMFDGRREFARRRHVVISASPELQERELIKLAALARALGDALAARGVPGPTAELTAQVAVAVFHVSFAGWVGERGGPSLSERMSGALDDLAEVASGG